MWRATTELGADRLWAGCPASVASIRNMKRKSASATMESPRMARTVLEPTLSFADMLRTADPEILRLVKIPAQWFPEGHHQEDYANRNKHQLEGFLTEFTNQNSAGTL